jgi:hypothetical protein
MWRPTLFFVETNEKRIERDAAAPARRHLIPHAHLCPMDFVALGGVGGSDSNRGLFAR